MPALRINKEHLSYKTSVDRRQVTMPKSSSEPIFSVAQGEETVDLAVCDVKYPMTATDRASFRTKTGKKVTPHQWAVYDFVMKIPVGKVTTYKDICNAIGEGSARSVGSALRNNPFAPYVPCHRIIASSGSIGGFSGERGKDGEPGALCTRKMEMLAKEGVGFTKGGYVVGVEDVIWKG